MTNKQEGGSIGPIEIPEEKIDPRLFGIAIQRFLNMWRNPSINMAVAERVRPTDITTSSVASPKSEIPLNDLNSDEPTNLRVDTDDHGSSVITCTIGNIDICLRDTAFAEVMRISHDKAVLEAIKNMKDGVRDANPSASLEA